MTVYVLIREDQSDLGYIDTSIQGVFRDKGAASEQEAIERREAQAQGLVLDDESSDAEWQVSWKIEDYLLR